MESSEWAVSRWCLQPTRWVCATVIVSNQVSHSSIICKGLKNVKIWLGRERIIFQSQWNLTKTQSLATWGIPVRCQTFSKDPRTSLQKWSQQKRCKLSDCFVPDFLFSPHSSVLSNKFVANAFSVPWDPIFPWWHVSLSSAPQPKLQGISSPADGWWALEVETGGCSSLQGGDALPEKWETQVSVEICVLKSHFFGTKQNIAASICQYSIHRPSLNRFLEVSLLWVCSSVWPFKPCNLTWPFATCGNSLPWVKDVEMLFWAKQFWVTAISAELDFGDGLQLQQKRCVGAAPSWAANIVGCCAETQRTIRPQRREGRWEGSGDGSEGRESWRCWSLVPCLCRCEVAFGAVGCERRAETKAARSSVRGDPLRLGWLWWSRCTRAEAGGSGLWHLAEQLRKPRRHQSSSHGWATRQQRELRWNGGVSTKHQADQSLWFKHRSKFC